RPWPPTRLGDSRRCAAAPGVRSKGWLRSASRSEGPFLVGDVERRIPELYALLGTRTPNLLTTLFPDISGQSTRERAYAQLERYACRAAHAKSTTAPRR